jgi:hypothetical protein
VHIFSCDAKHIYDMEKAVFDFDNIALWVKLRFTSIARQHVYVLKLFFKSLIWTEYMEKMCTAWHDKDRQCLTQHKLCIIIWTLATKKDAWDNNKNVEKNIHSLIWQGTDTA